MILDCHVHYFSVDYLQNLDRFVRIKESRDYLKDGISAKLAQLDISEATPRTYFETVRQQVDQAVLFGLADHPEGCRQLNDQVAQLCRAHPDRLFGFGTIPLPDLDMAKEEMVRLKESLNFAGIKIYPSLSRLTFKSEPVKKVLEYAAVLDLIVLTDCSFACWGAPDYFGSDNKFYHLIESLSEVEFRPRIIAAHLGGGLAYFKDLYTWSHGNNHFDTIWFDLSPFFPPSMIRAAVEVVSADRLLFGSDFPISSGQKMLNNMDSIDLSEQQKEKILWRNAYHLLEIE